jgi:hypothetical protein
MLDAKISICQGSACLRVVLPEASVAADIAAVRCMKNDTRHSLLFDQSVRKEPLKSLKSSNQSINKIPRATHGADRILIAEAKNRAFI